MARVRGVEIEEKLTVLLELDESEVRALDAIFGYNVDLFLKVFYEKMGRAYVEPHEDGVRSLHKTVRKACAGPLNKLGVARAAALDALRELEGGPKR